MQSYHKTTVNATTPRGKIAQICKRFKRPLTDKVFGGLPGIAHHICTGFDQLLNIPRHGLAAGGDAGGGEVGEDVCDGGVVIIVGVLFQEAFDV